MGVSGERVCVHASERERMRESLCVCERVSEFVCVCVIERESEFVCV